MSISPSFGVLGFCTFPAISEILFLSLSVWYTFTFYEVLFILYLFRGTSPLARFFSSEEPILLTPRVPLC